MEFLPNEFKGVFEMMNHKSKLQREESKGRRGLIHMEDLEELIRGLGALIRHSWTDYLERQVIEKNKMLECMILKAAIHLGPFSYK